MDIKQKKKQTWIKSQKQKMDVKNEHKTEFLQVQAVFEASCPL